MSSINSGKKIKLDSYDDLFGEAVSSEIQEISLDDLHPFKKHPFKVIENEDMQRLVESIREHGRVLVPGMARKRPEGGYELISGHRRHMASRLVGLETMPVIVKELTDEEATIIMVDANIQRENLLFSEKAWAYKMKFDALKHQGMGSRKNTDRKMPGSTEEIGKEADESARQVQRYIRLTELIPELLEMVDIKKLKFISAVDLSYLSKNEQKILLGVMKELKKVPSGSQAAQIKSLSGALDAETLKEILYKKNKDDKVKLVFDADSIRNYFPDYYETKEMAEVIIQLLKQWKKNQGDI